MRTLFITFVAALFAVNSDLAAQNVSINDNGDPANAKAMLDVQSNTKGLLIPRMSTADRTAIAPGPAEMGIMVYDTTEKAFYFHDGTDWKQMSSLWNRDFNGINRMSNIGVNENSIGNAGIYSHLPSGVGGPDTSAIYAYRAGISAEDSIGGTDWTPSDVSAAIKGYSNWGNPYSASVAGYGYLDYAPSAAVLGATQDARTLGALAYRHEEIGLLAGYFEGNQWTEGRVGIRSAPSSSFTLNVQTSEEDRTGYFYNNKVSDQRTFGIYGGAYGTGTGDKRGGSFDAVNGTGENIGVRGFAQNGTTNIGVYGFAGGGSTNWAAHFDAGYVIIDDRLGVGTVSPTYPVHIANSSSIVSQYIVQNYPTASTTYGLFISASNGGTGVVRGIYSSASGATNYAYYGVGNTYCSGDLRIGTTADPAGYRLVVNGNALVEELRIQDSGDWPDYVFEDSYELMSIKDLKSSIFLNGHLPGIPAASIVEEEGIAVGDMQKRMMEKIEEMALYIIQLDERIDNLQAENEVLKKALKEK